VPEGIAQVKDSRENWHSAGGEITTAKGDLAKAVAAGTSSQVLSERLSEGKSQEDGAMRGGGTGDQLQRD